MQLKIVCYKTDCFLHILQKAFFKHALVNSNQCFLNKLWNCLFSLHDFMVCDNIIFS